MKDVLGLDLSLTSSGYAYRLDDEIVTGRIVTKHLRGPGRLAFLEDSLLEVVEHADPDYAVIEGYAMGFGGRNPGRVFDIGEWGGVARLALYRYDIEMIIVSPSSLKMFATGNGGSAIKKPQIMQAIREIWHYDIAQDDEADAFVCMMLGEAYLSKRAARRYNANRIRALEKLERLTCN